MTDTTTQAVTALLPCPFCGTVEMLRPIGADDGKGWGVGAAIAAICALKGGAA